MNSSEAVVRVGKIGVYPDRFLKTCDGIVGSAERIVSRPQIVLGFRVIRS